MIFLHAKLLFLFHCLSFSCKIFGHEAEKVYFCSMKLFFSLFFLFCLSASHAQKIFVSRCLLDKNDSTAIKNETAVIDQNGKKCALIKLKTYKNGFSFDVGMLGITKIDHKKGEYWIYVPEGVKRISISHADYIALRDHDLGRTLKSGSTYISVLGISAPDYKYPCWFVFGTKKELKEQNILNARGEVLRGKFNRDYFTKIDRRIDTEIKLYSSSAQILSTHHEESYHLIRDEKKQYVLIIADPKSFWEINKYLVIQVK